jgi:hypothetical protein
MGGDPPAEGAEGGGCRLAPGHGHDESAAFLIALLTFVSLMIASRFRRLDG